MPPDTELGDQASRAQLKDAALSGARWITASRAVAEVVALVAAAVLAHLITPAEFGHAAVARILESLAFVFTIGGLGTPLVQRSEITRRHLETCTLMALGTGAALTAGTFFLAPIVAAPAFGDRTTELIQLLSPVFLLSGANVVPQAVLQRRLDFRRTSTIEVGGLLVGLTVSLVLAVLGLGAEALILGALSQRIAATAMSFVAVRPVVPRWHRTETRHILSFGAFVTLSSLVWQLQRNIDYAILGAKLGATQVGLYWRAFQVGVVYQGKVSGIMQRIALPVFSRAKTRDDLHALRNRIVRVNATVLFPLFAVYAVLAPDLLPLVFGENWTGAVLPSQILTISGAVATLAAVGGPLITAVGRPDALLTFGAMRLVVFATAIFLVAPLGIVAVAAAAVAVNVVSFPLLHHFVFYRIAGVHWRDTWREVWPALSSSLAVLAVCFPMAWALPDGETALRLFCVGATSAAIYMLILRGMHRDAWDDVIILFRAALFGRRSERLEPRSAAAQATAG